MSSNSIYTSVEPWRLNLLENPPRRWHQYVSSWEEWEDFVLNELIKTPHIFYGEKNGNYGNPTNYKHSEEIKQKISENNPKYWLGKTGENHPAYGNSRPDSKETVKLAHAARRGVPSWNSGRTDLPPHSDETKLKMSLAKVGIAKPKIECPHCHKIGGLPQMKQWHFDNCKVK